MLPQLLPFKSTKESGRLEEGLSSLLSSFLAQGRKEFESTTEKEARPNTGTTKRVEAMTGFWCFNKMFKGIKSRKRGRDKIRNLKTTCLLCRPQGTVIK